MTIVQKKFNLLSLILGFFLFAGCHNLPKHPIPRLDEKTYNAQNAVVVIKTYSVFMSEEFRVTTQWALLDDRYSTDNKQVYSFETTLLKDWKSYIPGYVLAQTSLRFGMPVSYDAYIVPPGRYTLEFMEATINDVMYKTPLEDGWDADRKEPKWAEFIVNAGDVIYLGDLEFHFAKDKAGIYVDNQFKTAADFLQSEYPWLKTKLERRPVKVSWTKRYEHALKYVGPPKEKDGLYQ